MRPITQALAIGGISAVALATFAGTALAEPTSTPVDTAITAVGSDTIQYLADSFQADSVGNGNFFSYDAISNSGTALSSTITAKQGCAAVTRPTSSGSGIAALAANATTGDTSDGPAGTYCIDIARASRVPASTDPTGLAFVPIAGDAIAWTAEQATNLPANLTVTDLKAIYSCDASIISSSDSGPVTMDEIGGKGTDAVAPVLPQTSSGTRATFLTAIGLGVGTTGPGSCVVNGTNSLNGVGDGTVIEENEGTNEIFGRSSIVNTKDLVFPYSIGVYINQDYLGNGSGTNEPGPLVLESLNSKKPTSGSGAKTTIDKKYPIQRQLFFVTRRTSAKPYVPTYLQAFLGADNNKGAVCSKQALKDDTAVGFLSLGSKCGVLTAQDLT